MEGDLSNTEKHCEMLRNRGLEDLAGFYEWFEENTPVEDGEALDLPVDKISEQDFFDQSEALYIMNAFLLGSNWEAENPRPSLSKQK